MRKRYTKEEFAQKVAQGEARLGHQFFYIPSSLIEVEPVKEQHAPECCCSACFDLRLDEILARSRASLRALDNPPVENNIIPVVEENQYTEPFKLAIINANSVK